MITGCDSGFGRGAAIQLASKGVKVFASCLTQVFLLLFRTLYLLRNVSIRRTLFLS